MSFQVSAEAYDRFMGRWSEPLAATFVERVGVRHGQRALDVGSGPGALTRELVGRLGADHVAAVDPSASFVEAARDRFPGVDVGQGAAERLPFEDDGFDLCLAHLVVHFMADPALGLREMARVTRSGGTVAACVWDHTGGSGPLSLFWDAVHELDPLAGGERGLAGASEGELADMFGAAGLADIRSDVLTVKVSFTGVDDWWEPFRLGVGPAGAYVADLNEDGRDLLRAECARRLPDGAFTLPASAWVATARVP